jgi:hypothetical protein
VEVEGNIPSVSPQKKTVIDCWGSLAVNRINGRHNLGEPLENETSRDSLDVVSDETQKFRHRYE